jgi:hypothetical protein
MYNIVMSVRYEDAIKYPYLELVAEWAMRTNNNLVPNQTGIMLKYPIFPKGYDILDQQIENGLSVPLEKLVVIKDSANKEDNYEYNPKSNTWSNLVEEHTFQSRFDNFNIMYDPFSHPEVPGFIYEITNNSVPPRTLGLFSVPVPYQVAAPSSFQAGNERESRSLDKATANTKKARSRSGSPHRQWDRAGKERGCKGPGCVVMGGKKKTRRHKSKKQKKSKSKFKRHKKSKRHTRGRK